MKRISFLLLLCLVSLSSTPSNASTYDPYFEESAFEKIEDDKYYVKPGNVWVSPNAILLHVEGQLIPISSLECDAEGIFVRGANESLIRCSKCKSLLLPSGVCLKCSGKGF